MYFDYRYPVFPPFNRSIPPNLPFFIFVVSDGLFSASEILTPRKISLHSFKIPDNSRYRSNFSTQFQHFVDAAARADEKILFQPNRPSALFQQTIYIGQSRRLHIRTNELFGKRIKPFIGIFKAQMFRHG